MLCSNYSWAHNQIPDEKNLHRRQNQLIYGERAGELVAASQQAAYFWYEINWDLVL